MGGDISTIKDLRRNSCVWKKQTLKWGHIYRENVKVPHRSRNDSFSDQYLQLIPRLGYNQPV